jgi:hypothetical protein
MFKAVSLWDGFVLYPLITSQIGKCEFQTAMSQFILGMSVSLYNWDKKFGPTGGSLPFDYYYKLSFAGLIKDGTTELLEEAQ